MSNQLYTLPCDLTAEAAIIATAFLSAPAVEKVATWLQPDWFYLERNGAVWEAIQSVYQRSGLVDLASVVSEMRRSEALERIGGRSRLAEMLNAECNIFQADAYARSIAECYRRRRLIEAGGQITALGYDEAMPLADVLSSAEQRIYQIATEADPGEGFVSIGGIAQDRYSEYQEIVDGSREIPGVPTGIACLDSERLLRTLKPGQMVTIAARPSMGKSALALSIVYNLARDNRRCAFVSLEMGRNELLDRLASMHTGLRLDRISNYELSGAALGLYTEALGVLTDWPIYIDDQPGQTIETIRARARRLHQHRPLDALFIDYLQLIAFPKGTEANENAALTHISKGIKALARELQIPVISLAQLSREVERRSVKIPMLADLRGSGSIEQDSDVVLFINREEKYDPETKRKGIADLYVAKNRQGPTGQGEAAFHADRALFASLSTAYKGVEGYE